MGMRSILYSGPAGPGWGHRTDGAAGAGRSKALVPLSLESACATRGSSGTMQFNFSGPIRSPDGDGSVPLHLSQGPGRVT